MTGGRSFWRDRRGASAAEFALILPLLLIFMFGIIDVGRFMYEYNRAEKATQIGARMAAATQVIDQEIASYSYATDPSPPIPQGDPIPADDVPTIECTSVSCTCTQSCPDGWESNADLNAFQALVNRMREIKPDIEPANVTVVYSPSGTSGGNDLGYSGDPTGADVVPLITVKVSRLKFHPSFLPMTVDMPIFSYSLTMEDGAGVVSN